LRFRAASLVEPDQELQLLFFELLQRCLGDVAEAQLLA
jgi:hypothetical protein